jgi:hypothetical protein
VTNAGRRSRCDHRSASYQYNVSLSLVCYLPAPKDREDQFAKPFLLENPAAHGGVLGIASSIYINVGMNVISILRTFGLHLIKMSAS